MTDFTTTSASITPDRTPRRVRHELRFRRLAVQTVQRLTPHLIRITLAGDDLEGFASPGFDDHAKIFFPDAAGQLALPTMGPDGPVWPAGGRPAMRDYTPRRHDARANTLELDFALHEAGPATQWAERARPGDVLGVGGPRGSFIVPTAFDWHLLIGDDTALPAIARRLAELPAGARVVVLAEVDSEADQVPFETQAELTLKWVHRNGAEPGLSPVLLDTLKAMELPAGDFHAWVGCESAIAKALRAHLVGERGANPKWTRASGYWRRGAAATHDTHDE
ncbi:NADPH-dependent ferric siderophore reductase [Variovorax beijingensis]|uniref:NADPH-dependent ferric siderophore reductase n=2 Tax=Variovorax TaxID=34072 RepID=A0AAE3XW82_VARPD|nr:MULTISPECIES: siderophore-interacting protein [Variovorax]MBD9664789.1 siderophore-interacting protein [Variovorax sp. VRV01]MDP9963744.1 NADPH-dependent ferric siderophore reductase [Variovorax paradoxus]MDR6426024.1 NADPH-dependent ferric siderophore reductase [Variovorax paradoxus]TWD77683.1 NADPH-dependent ferric siderophore reductase [Variovorax beijingensis]